MSRQEGGYQIVTIEIQIDDLLITGGRPCQYLFETEVIGETIRFLDDMSSRRRCRWIIKSDQKEYVIEIRRINGTDMEAVAVDVICWLNRRTIPFDIADKTISISRGAD